MFALFLVVMPSGRFFNKAMVDLSTTILWSKMEAYCVFGERNLLGKSKNPVKELPLGVMGVDRQFLMDFIATED